ncbi:MAG: cysteine desulfurase / selenocysteine lyase [Acidimicrobiia bacterium]|nr:cysteine desulfurase / selenocysteine lyase [Acidimicrobiia bacterium]
MAVTSPLDVERIKKDFPILRPCATGRELIYLDSAATSQKPQAVLDAMDRYYETANANVHRGAYWLAEQATNAMEEARAKVRAFIGASSDRELVFVRNATEGINLVAHSYGRQNLQAGDAVLLTHLEHHANIVPWQILAAERGIEIRWIPLTDQGELDLSDLDRLLEGVKVVGVSAQSNVLGTMPPVAEIVAAAHRVGAVVVVDACQFVPHHTTDIAAWGADFVAFSAHKMCGPTGIGALWGRQELLEAMPPFLGGGSMILNVTLDGFTPTELPWKFEAGTPAIAEIVGFGASVDYLDGIGMDQIAGHERSLTVYALDQLRARHGDKLRIYGPDDPTRRGGMVSFSYGDVHPHDVSQVLDQAGICVRAGHHCAKPLLSVMNVTTGALTRASWYLYNDFSDIDALVETLAGVDDLFF